MLELQFLLLFWNMLQIKSLFYAISMQSIVLLLFGSFLNLHRVKNDKVMWQNIKCSIILDFGFPFSNLAEIISFK